MKILLVRAPLNGDDKIGEVFEALGIGYLASFLRQYGYEVDILDAEFEELSIDETIEFISYSNADIIGFTIESTPKIDPVIKIINAIKEIDMSVHITIGGHVPTFAYEELFNEIPRLNSIIRGEGEITLYKLVKAIENHQDWRDLKGLAFIDSGKVIVNNPRNVIANLNVLPFPARDSLYRINNIEDSIITISGSRGCYAKCTFCSVPNFYRLAPGPILRYRDPDNLVDEMEILVKNYGVKDILFVDDIFIGPGEKGKKRTISFAEEILSRNLRVIFSISCRATEVEKELFLFLKQAGLRQVHLGIESAVQDILDRYKKGLKIEQNLRALEIIHDLDLDLSLGFIMFDHMTTIEDVEINLKFLETLNVNFLRGALNLLQPFKGTDIERNMLENNILFGNYKELRYEFVDERITKLFKIITNTMGPMLLVSFELDRIARKIRNRISFADSETSKRNYEELKGTFKQVRKFILDEFINIYR